MPDWRNWLDSSDLKSDGCNGHPDSNSGSGIKRFYIARRERIWAGSLRGYKHWSHKPEIVDSNSTPPTNQAYLFRQEHSRIEELN